MKENCFNKDYHKEDHKELTQYLLLHDQGAVSTPNNEGDLLFHIAFDGQPFDIAKLVCNAYPEALRRQNRNGDTVFDYASWRWSSVEVSAER
jgi:ankyrin repeat protein